MAPLLDTGRECAICEVSIEDRAANVRYCSKRCRYRKCRMAKTRKFEPMRAAEQWARYIDDAKRDVLGDADERGIDDPARKKSEICCSLSVDLSPSEPKRVEKAQFSPQNTTVCSGECPKCGTVWRGSRNCRRCGHRFLAVLF